MAHAPSTAHAVHALPKQHPCGKSRQIGRSEASALLCKQSTDPHPQALPSSAAYWPYGASGHSEVSALLCKQSTDARNTPKTAYFINYR